jgi:hypothetical protein
MDGRNNAAASKGPVSVIRPLRLRRNHCRLRGHKRNRERSAAQKPSPAYRRDNHVQLLHLLAQFYRGGPLPCNHPKVIVRVDKGGPGSRDDFGQSPLTGFKSGFTEDDFRTITGHGELFYMGSVFRHDHIGGNASPSCRQGKSGRMVSRRVSGDTSLRFIFAQGENRVAGTTNLESSGFLEILTFEKDFSAAHPIDRGGGQDRGSMDEGFDPLVGLTDIF